MNTFYIKSAALVLGLLLPLFAHAGLITVGSSLLSDKANANDCSGVFGQGFENCQVNGSSIIAKYGYDDGVFEGADLNTSVFPSIDGGEFTINLGAGTWSYNPGADDPSVRYWVAKGGNDGFNLFYVVPDALQATCSGDGLSQSCLDAAVAQTSGAFFTPTRQALSHISFYNGGASVPEPGSLAVLAFGLLSLGMLRKRAAR